MTKKKWAEQIKERCKSVGSYKPEFDMVINELAELLEEKDRIGHRYKKEGSESLVEHTNKAGATNLIVNPLLKQILELKKLSLPYLRDLGLTSAGLKKLNEDALKGKKKSALGEALKNLGG